MTTVLSPSTKIHENYLSWINRKTYTLATVLLAINLIVLIIPLTPMQPSAELDPSWMLSVNQALSQNLVFGREFIFTIGPYGSLYTWQHHPATATLMLTSTIAFTFGWAISLLSVTTGHLRIALCLLSFFLLIIKSHDLMILGYPFLIMLWTVSNNDTTSEKNISRRLTDSTKLYAFSLLGLLPLVKLSTLPLCIIATIMTVMHFSQQRKFRQAFIFSFTPAASMIIFWLTTGQPLIALPDYFMNGGDIISGYSEAMAIPGKPKMIVFYLLICLCLAATTLWSRNFRPHPKAYLFLSLSSFLFIIMKASFVRHDGHALLAGAGITFASAMTFIALRSKTSLAILCVSLLYNNYIHNHYRDFNLKTTISAVAKSYIDAVDGLSKRIFFQDYFNQRYENALAQIRSTSPLPKVSGTSDIYSYEQATLIASRNIWSPRPIMQSYSAYTPKLAELNRRHVIGKNSTDNIFFRVQPIDDRLPSLEDGPSWPAIMQRYEMINLYGEFIHLQKRSMIPDIPPSLLLQRKAKMGVPLSIPPSNTGIIARLHFKKSLAGRLANLFYKTSNINILIETHGGYKKTFRLIPQMAEAGFIISPHIETTTDFAWMATNHSDLLPQVKQITLTTDPKYQLLWQPTLDVELLSFEIPIDSYSSTQPIGLSNNVALPSLLPESECTAAIDIVDVRPEVGPAKLLNISGWLVMDSKTGKAPDQVIVTLKDSSGNMLSFSNSEQHARPDVSNHLKTSKIELSGFTALIDVRGLSGEIEIKLSKKSKGIVTTCTTPKKSFSI